MSRMARQTLPHVQVGGRGRAALERMSMPARIEDVAATAGVSMKTVSRVFNNEPNVREKTRLRVEAAAKELNYRPNPSARGLAGNRSYLISLVYDDPAAGSSYIMLVDESHRADIRIERSADSPLGLDWFDICADENDLNAAVESTSAVLLALDAAAERGVLRDFRVLSGARISMAGAGRQRWKTCGHYRRHAR